MGIPSSWFGAGSDKVPGYQGLKDLYIALVDCRQEHPA
jgi:hypothetical protein